MLEKFIWCTPQIFFSEKTPDSCVSWGVLTILKISSKNINFPKSYLDFATGGGKNVLPPTYVLQWPPPLADF